MADVLRGEDRGTNGRHHRDGLRPASISLEGKNPEVGPAACVRVRVERGSGRGDASGTERDLSIRVDPTGRLDAPDGHLSPDHEADRSRFPAWNARVPRPARSSARPTAAA